MKAIHISHYGETGVLQCVQCPAPEVEEDEILVKNHYIGLNYIDIYFRKGIYKAPYLPFVPGFEGSGEIIKIGSKVKNFTTGMQVGYVNCRTGAYAEMTALKATDAIPLPNEINSKTAAATLLQGLTAHYLSHSTAPIQPGNKVLIHAGAGGVGQLLIQMAKQLGAYVFTTVSSAAKQDMLKSLGADRIILYKDEDFLEVIHQSTGGQGLEMVYDAVGKDTYERSLKCLARRGILVSFGQSSGPIPEIDPLSLVQKSLYLTRPKLGDYLATSEEKEQRAHALFEGIVQKRLQFHIDKIFSLEEANKAHAYLESRQSMGKILLQV